MKEDYVKTTIEEIEDHAGFNNTAVNTVLNYIPEKTYIVCKKCGDLAEVDTSLVLTSMPPQYSWHCPHCDTHGYIYCSEVSAVNPEIWRKTKARMTTTCKICGSEILIYGDENPVICEDCRQAIIKVKDLIKRGALK